MRSLRLGFSGKVTRSKSGKSFPIEKLTSNSKVLLIRLYLGARQSQRALRVCALTFIHAGALVFFTFTRNS